MKNEVRADDAERSLLGALLLNPRHRAAAQGVVSATDFAGEPHRTLWGALEGMYAAREPIGQDCWDAQALSCEPRGRLAQ